MAWFCVVVLSSSQLPWLSLHLVSRWLEATGLDDLLATTCGCLLGVQVNIDVMYIYVYALYTIYWYRSSLTIHHTTHNASDDFVSSMLVIALVQASLLISDWIGSIISAHCEYWSWYRCQYWLQLIKLNIWLGLPACLLARVKIWAQEDPEPVSGARARPANVTTAQPQRVRSSF